MSQKKSTSRTNEQKSVKRGQHISKQGRGGRGKSEPGVESNPGQLYNRRRWRSDERQKEAREPIDPWERTKALNGSNYYTTFKGTEAKNDAPGSAPITARYLHVGEELLNEFVNEQVNDQTSDWKSDALGIQTETPPSITEQLGKAKKRKKKKRNKKSPSDQRRSVLRHHKHPFLVDDDAIVVYDENVEGDDEQESSPSDHDVKRRRSRERKKTKRSCTRRGREQSSSTDEEENFVETLPPPAPKHEAQTNPQLQANTRVRNIPQEYRTRAAALRTRSPTDYMLNGFSNASMRVFEFATGACANPECAYTTRTRTESCNRNSPCMTSQLPPLLTRGIVSGGCVQPTSHHLAADDDPARGHSRNRNSLRYRM